ncbi:hypothetical protein [Rhodanobacter sp. AS-Z3]|uniref:hypothetical protein n=1 Tax=Rhodanobacter sp. AS-Z3 TaxID=3031330 RepID=UPI0031F2E15E
MLAKALQGTLAIRVVQKTGQTIISPPHHVLRNTGEIEAWKSGPVRHDRAAPYS